MARIALQTLVAVALVAIGWIAGMAQKQQGPQFFRLTINSPTGSTIVRCDGSKLFSWNEGRATALRELTFICGGPQSCSQTFGGTLTGPLQMASNGVYSK
jgi:hypothetical protein